MIIKEKNNFLNHTKDIGQFRLTTEVDRAINRAVKGIIQEQLPSVNKPSFFTRFKNTPVGRLLFNPFAYDIDIN